MFIHPQPLIFLVLFSTCSLIILTCLSTGPTTGPQLCCSLGRKLHLGASLSHTNQLWHRAPHGGKSQGAATTRGQPSLTAPTPYATTAWIQRLPAYGSADNLHFLSKGFQWLCSSNKEQSAGHFPANPLVTSRDTPWTQDLHQRGLLLTHGPPLASVTFASEQPELE